MIFEEYEVEVFKNEEFGEIRTVTINGEPWFVGKDIATALGYGNTNDALKKHVMNEDKLMGSQNATPSIKDTLGRTQYPTWINESGLYSLIFGSKLESAKNFKRWITSEVLPTIRKTGGFVNNDDLFINTYFPYADESTKAMFKSTLSTVRKQNQIIEKQKKELKYKEDVIIGLVDDITLAEKRQILNRVVRYNHANYSERWSALYREFENKYHISLQQRLNAYNENYKPKCRNKLDYIDRVMDKVPELYEIATKLYANDVKSLVEEMYGVAS